MHLRHVQGALQASVCTVCDLNKTSKFKMENMGEVGKRYRPNVSRLAQHEHLFVVALFAETCSLGIEIGLCTTLKHHTIFQAATTN